MAKTKKLTLPQLIDKAGRLNCEIKTKTASLDVLKTEIKQLSEAGDNEGDRYICKKVVTDLYSDLDPAKVKEQFNWLMLDEKDFLSCCKMKMTETRGFLSNKMIEDLHTKTGEKVALTFRKR